MRKRAISDCGLRIADCGLIFHSVILEVLFNQE